MTDHQLARCGVCGRYGWHETGKCPEALREIERLRAANAELVEGLRLIAGKLEAALSARDTANALRDGRLR